MPISRSAKPKALLAVTLGDAAGIGPEVTLKALSKLSKNALGQIVLIGKASFYKNLSRHLGLRLQFQDIAGAYDLNSRSKAIPCYFPYEFPDKLVSGRYSREWTQVAVHSIETAARLAMTRIAQAVVTAPIHKANLKKAGFDIPGHTEYLAKLSRTKRFEMMLVGGPLRVVLVTRHTPIRDVSKNISKCRIVETTLLAIKELKESFGIKNPRVVVCGLNPHAGEQGTIGSEERRVIEPAVRELKKKTKVRIDGPLSPDALFYDAYTGKYDAEICMYHDQGLIPLKMISRGHGVNVTLGLPFVRTSPDHGTAYDIAGLGKADPGSMLQAIHLAASIASNRKRHA